MMPAWMFLAAVAVAGPWERDIRAFEAADRKAPPAPGGIVFVGSSSIRMWDLPKSFPDLPVINRGFGGSQLADAVLYAHRIVTPYQPRIVVLYAGDNDIASGKSPEQVAADFTAFVKTVRVKAPRVRIIFLSIKPSVARWPLWGTMQRANALIRAAVEADRRTTLAYLDVGTALLGPDGAPDPRVLMDDGLHLNAEGYARWNALLGPRLRARP